MHDDNIIFRNRKNKMRKKYGTDFPIHYHLMIWNVHQNFKNQILKFLFWLKNAKKKKKKKLLLNFWHPL